MEPTTTIRAELEHFMKQNGLNITQLGLVADINPGTVSGIVTGNRTLSVQQLDRITATLGYSKGHLYKNYIEEFLSTATPNIRRVRPLLYNCAELDMLDYIEQVVSLLMEKLAYADALFTIAEDFFQQGKFAASIILYESVAVGEKKQHSERLALCQYRIFMAKQGENQQKNHQAATQFEPFVERLDEIDQLDALRDLANTYRSLRLFNKLEELIPVLESKAEIQYSLNEKREKRKKSKMPLFFYRALPHLLRACVSEAIGDYKQALQHTYAYSDLSWVKEKDKETQYWMDRFKEWAQANTYVNKLLSGDVSTLPEYVAYIESKKDELLLALLNIIEAANRFDINVDHILQKFEIEIKSLAEQHKDERVYTKQFISERFARYLNELADYYLRKGMYTNGFKYLISSLEKSSIIKINSKSCIIKSVELFERYNKYASSKTIASYRNLISRVH